MSRGLAWERVQEDRPCVPRSGYVGNIADADFALPQVCDTEARLPDTLSSLGQDRGVSSETSRDQKIELLCSLLLPSGPYFGSLQGSLSIGSREHYQVSDIEPFIAARAGSVREESWLVP